MALPGLVRANNLNDVVDRERAWDNLGSSLATGDISIPTPSLDLNFAANKSLVDNISGNNLITFSRASTGTFVGSNGLIQSAASGVPRFDHNPETGESLGLLVEEARTNFLTYSTGTTGWTTGSFSDTIAPDGTATAIRINAIGANLGDSKSFTAIASSYTGSCYARSRTGVDQSVKIAFSGISGTARIVPGSGAWVRVQSNAAVALGAGTRTFNVLAVNDSEIDIDVWGAQAEAGAFPTSYIPTVASTVTRAADVATISGANLSSFYNAGAGTIYTEQPRQGSTAGVVIGDSASNRLLDWQPSRIYRTSWGGVNYTWTGAPAVSATSLNRAVLSYGQTARGAVNGTSYALSPFIATASFPTASLAFQGIFSRIIFWGTQLPANALTAVTAISNVQVSNLPSSYSVNTIITGRDILALNAVRNASTRSFIFIKGLLSAAQPRLTTAAALASSGIANQNASLLKASPTSFGSFFIDRGGIAASGLQINGTNIASLSSSAFSGSTALFPIVVSSLKLSSGLRWTPAMTAGTITSPDKAIPIETSEFILFAKAGQS